jgi:hypothetical protein
MRLPQQQRRSPQLRRARLPTHDLRPLLRGRWENPVRICSSRSVISGANGLQNQRQIADFYSRLQAEERRREGH